MPSEQSPNGPTSSHDPVPVPPRTGRWWHKNGYFTVEVVGVHRNDRGWWFEFFNEQNCDDSLAEHAEAEVGEGVVKKQWYDSNFMQVMHEDRFLSKFVPDPVNARPIRIRHYDADGVELVFPALPVAEPQP